MVAKQWIWVLTFLWVGEAVAEPDSAEEIDNDMPHAEETARAWGPGWAHERAGWVWELSAGGTVHYAHVPQSDGLLYVGGSIAVGFRRIHEFWGSSLVGQPRESWALGAPLAVIAFPSLVFLPLSAFIGNEIGLDLHVQMAPELLAGESGVWVALGLRPIFRATRDHVVRNSATLGIFVPEVGVELDAERRWSFYVEWCLSAYAFRIHTHFAIEWHVARFAVVFPLDGAAVENRFSTELVLLAL